MFRLPRELSSELAHSCFAALALFFSAFTTPVAAQDSLALLPGSKEQDAVFYLSKGNVESFKDVLVAPIAEWITDGRMVASVRRDLNFEWVLSPEWEAASNRAAEVYGLDAAGNLTLKTGPSAVSGFPFGRGSMVNKETDLERRGAMILWNASHAVRTTRDSLYGVELSWLSSQGLMRKASGFHFYVTDGEAAVSSAASSDLAPVSPAASPVFFRDVFKLLAPPVVGGFSIATWRYLDSQDDSVWVHSPVLGRTRRVLGPNRSDPILGSALMADDLFVFSGKPQQFSAKVLEEKVLLLPFASLRVGELKLRALTKAAPIVETTDASSSISSSGLPPAAGASSSIKQSATPGAADVGEQILSASELFSRRDGSMAFIMWNHETGRFPQAAAWLPTTVTFVPRRVWLVELEPKDPFYLSGKQILVVDQESMLPFYKLVYERNGSYKKTVFGAWALASDSTGAAKLPYLAGLVAVEHQSRVAAAVTTDSVRTFLGRETKRASELRQELMPASTSASSSSAVSALSAGAASESPSSEGIVAEPTPND